MLKLNKELFRFYLEKSGVCYYCDWGGALSRFFVVPGVGW
jgi:hypothetical protein